MVNPSSSARWIQSTHQNNSSIHVEVGKTPTWNVQPRERENIAISKSTPIDGYKIPVPSPTQYNVGTNLAINKMLLTCSSQVNHQTVTTGHVENNVAPSSHAQRRPPIRVTTAKNTPGGRTQIQPQ